MSDINIYYYYLFSIFTYTIIKKTIYPILKPILNTYIFLNYKLELQ